MFIAIYSFKVRPGAEKAFERSWRDLTKRIYEYEGSLGSRLHTSEPGTYIAYAQWPDRKTWEHAGKKLPESAKTVSQQMKDSCEKIETIFQLDVIDDLLKSEIHTV